MFLSSTNPMATETVSTDRIQELFTNLEAEKTLITNCTLLWKNISDHVSSLEQTLALRSQELDSKLQALDSQTNQTIETLDLRESSIPDSESSAVALIEQRKESILSEIENPDSKTPADVQGLLHWYCRRMDSAGLWRFMVSRRKDLAVLRRDISDAVSGSVDPIRLVLDAVEDFVNQQQSGGSAPGAPGSPDQCWALGMLLRALFDSDGRKAPEVSGIIKERAAAVAEKWKAKVDGEGEGVGSMGGSEAQMFLQMVVAFGLQSKFDAEFLRKLVLEHASRKEIPKLAAGLGFGEKLADTIDELVKNGKELEAVYFAYESGLTERFAPVSLLKSHLQSSRKRANTILKNGNHSIVATEESSTVELNALRSIIKCVEINKLEPKFALDGLKNRVAQLEKAKADRKKAAAANKSQMKRARTGGAAPTYRPAKAIRTSNASFTSFHRNPPPAHQFPATRRSYNYQSQGGFEGPASAPYGGAYSRSPASISQQYYVPEDMGGPRSGGSYGGPLGNYGGYDYAAVPSAPAQPSYPH